MAEDGGAIVKITAVGTITIPKRYRREMGVRRGDYVKVSLEGDRIIVRRAELT